LMNKLELFFETRELPDESFRPKLRLLLTQQHTARNIKLMFMSLKQRQLFPLIELFFDDKFKLSLACCLVFVYLKKSFRAYMGRIFPDVA